MEFTNVFSDEEMPARRLKINAQMAMRGGMPSGQAIHVMREKMARNIADLIVKEQSIFRFETVRYGGEYLNITGSVVVLTQDELHTLMRSQFRKGIEHAQGFGSTVQWIAPQGQEVAPVPSTDVGEG